MPSLLSTLFPPFLQGVLGDVHCSPLFLLPSKHCGNVAEAVTDPRAPHVSMTEWEIEPGSPRSQSNSLIIIHDAILFYYFMTV